LILKDYSTRTPMKEPEKVPRELKRSETLQEEYQYELISISRAPWNCTTNQRKHVVELVALAIYVAEVHNLRPKVLWIMALFLYPLEHSEQVLYKYYRKNKQNTA
jgi:hypothetical protein